MISVPSESAQGTRQPSVRRSCREGPGGYEPCGVRPGATTGFRFFAAWTMILAAMRTRLFVNGLIVLVASAAAFAQRPASTSDRRLDVAAAADLKFAMDELAGAFGKAHPDIAVSVTYGSSGNFLSQIQNGAPFDLFFSADIEYPKRLAEAGLAQRGSEFRYAVGRIVVW